MDEDVNVTPQSSGYFVVNLTTSVATGNAAEGQGVLRRAVWHLFGPSNHGDDGTSSSPSTIALSPEQDPIVWSGHFFGRVRVGEQNTAAPGLPPNVYRVASSAISGVTRSVTLLSAQARGGSSVDMMDHADTAPSRGSGTRNMPLCSRPVH